MAALGAAVLAADVVWADAVVAHTAATAAAPPTRATGVFHLLMSVLRSRVRLGLKPRSLKTPWWHIERTW
jgi:hypothetical protein